MFLTKLCGRYNEERLFVSLSLSFSILTLFALSFPSPSNERRFAFYSFSVPLKTPGALSQSAAAQRLQDRSSKNTEQRDSALSPFSFLSFVLCLPSNFDAGIELFPLLPTYSLLFHRL